MVRPANEQAKEVAEKLITKTAPSGHGSASHCEHKAPIPSRDQRERFLGLFQQPLIACQSLFNKFLKLVRLFEGNSSASMWESRTLGTADPRIGILWIIGARSSENARRRREELRKASSD